MFHLNLHDRIGHVLRRAYQRHVAIFQQAMSQYKLTAAQFIVLATLLESGGASQSDLVRQTAIDQATIRGIIDRLKARGLVITTVDPADARKVSVSLTPEGSEVTEGAAEQVEGISDQTFNGLNEAERVAALYLLRRMADMESTP
ncbi:MarR family winged helix-turn-helix transcriptional regulator [Variovorax saccharolyticus]|uniref:MarR family winged helix-turn-helix transcriptional regulator n=1 Tax=Variovorax saccharolyticus TaxID=3053516 RepID=UPI002577F52F|nr:MarR family transcriptional regulator [Variovorax sp. J22R187]MDM0021871.1 MarR family transcriptional regulator [Variovorax sp. J22R187]